MRKVKNRPALFELYERAEQDESNPEAGIGRTSVGESASAFRATLSSLAKSVGSRLEGEQHSATMQRTPTFRVEHERLVVSLGRIGGLVGLALLLSLFAAMFSAGRWVGWNSGVADGQQQAKQSIQRAALDEIEVARRSQPVEDLFAGIGKSPVAPVSAAKVSAAKAGAGTVRAVTPAPRVKRPRLAATPPASPWVRGYSYVIVQHFRSNARADAEAAQLFMNKRGVDTAIDGDKSTGFRLIAMKGFNLKDRTQKKIGEQFRRKIHRIGQAYRDSGGRYKLEGYFATLTGDSW